MPNQFGLDRFDFTDAYNEKQNYMCSKGLKDLVEKHHLDLNNDGKFNPRLAFGSHSDSDHVYNTPRAWYMGRYFNSKTFKWDGDNADYTPESDDIPWALVPERKITIEDVKYILSSYFQGTIYNPYTKGEVKGKGKYRPIGINRTGVMCISQIRDYVPKEIAAIEWVCFGANPFNTIVPIYTNTDEIPKYFSDVTLTISTDNFYWSSRLLGALTDPHYASSIIYVERYQYSVMSQGHNIINKYDELCIETKEYNELIRKANSEVAEMAKKETDIVLSKVLLDASIHMKDGYNRADN